MVSALVKAFYKVADPILSAVANPIKTIAAAVSPTKTVKQVQNEFFSKPKTQQAVEFAVGALAAGSIAGAAVKGTLVGATKAVATSLIPKTAKGKVIAALAAPVVVSTVVRNPVAVADAPGKVLNAQIDAGKLIADPSVANAKQFVQEHPVATTLAGAGLVIGTGATVAPIVSNILNREAVQEQTKAIKEQTKVLESGGAGANVAGLPSSTPLVSTTATAPQTPITPATAPLIATAGASTSKKRRKARTAMKMQPISQRVNVIVSNRAQGTTTKNYLKREVLLN